ncbi:DUF4124 domain-containing protein [Gilvimarinus sp. 1_MG-2023]|uniref:DUF4124 domain-containing protein n=1 Tax=Gilvimarinus sp. 1_MG-2023 TaxID=3062638 RepID=UPI0026E47958|nr:DUF4124 domain-containing protein [Gilvimarinus sp. 1_MG-2023]MDO6747195.1 DUF4124 domain-containing protein [Gilvimarinus sp. 1_MG-2023]
MENLKMIKLIVAVVLIAGATSANAAQVFKCTDENGKVEFSQRPCDEAKAVTEEQLTIENGSKGLDVVAGGDWSKVEAENEERGRVRTIDRKINTHQQNIDILIDERDAKIAILRGEQGNARNNAAGAAYHNSLATEIQTITLDYNSRIQAERDAIARLREQY